MKEKVFIRLGNSVNTDRKHNIILMLIVERGVKHRLKILAVYCHHKSLVIMENTIFVRGVLILFELVNL